jgi:hypothetical protein
MNRTRSIARPTLALALTLTALAVAQGPFRKGLATIETRATPNSVAAGEVVTVEVTIRLSPGAAVLDVEQSNTDIPATSILFDDADDTIAVESLESPKAAEWVEARFEGKTVRGFETSPTFRQKVLLTADGKPGRRSVRGRLNAIVFDKASGRRQVFVAEPFAVTVEVRSREAAGKRGDAAMPPPRSSGKASGGLGVVPLTKTPEKSGATPTAPPTSEVESDGPKRLRLGVAAGTSEPGAKPARAANGEPGPLDDLLMPDVPAANPKSTTKVLAPGSKAVNNVPSKPSPTTPPASPVPSPPAAKTAAAPAPQAASAGELVPNPLRMPLTPASMIHHAPDPAAKSATAPGATPPASTTTDERLADADPDVPPYRRTDLQVRGVATLLATALVVPLLANRAAWLLWSLILAASLIVVSATEAAGMRLTGHGPFLLAALVPLLPAARLLAVGGRGQRRSITEDDPFAAFALVALAGLWRWPALTPTEVLVPRFDLILSVAAVTAGAVAGSALGQLGGWWIRGRRAAPARFGQEPPPRFLPLLVAAFAIGDIVRRLALAELANGTWDRLTPSVCIAVWTGLGATCCVRLLLPWPSAGKALFTRVARVLALAALAAATLAAFASLFTAADQLKLLRLLGLPA